jgi:hypothetical protein
MAATQRAQEADVAARSPRGSSFRGAIARLRWRVAGPFALIQAVAHINAHPLSPPRETEGDEISYLPAGEVEYAEVNWEVGGRHWDSNQ